ncbi:MAG: AmmeMemoRadiSam system radical SAM enzyme [Dehalococcoidales bacterium]
MAEDRVRQALLYEHLKDKVRCLTCERHCLISEGESGFCASRKNIGGQLYTLEYGEISSISANPIEKKPLFHFYPGTKALTIGCWSCNFTCPWCQNYDISKAPQNIGRGEYISPATFVELIARHRCQGSSVSFNEPTMLFEYSLDVFDLARDKGYYNTYVTNGYMTVRALELLVAHGLDAVNIDIKGEAEAVKRFCGADVNIVWRNATLAKKCGVWVELTTLVIPGVNDTEGGLSRIARRIKGELGDDTPWHVNGYYPAYRFSSELYVPPTPVSTLEKVRNIGKAEGLKYVYAGNVPGHPYEHTYCPGCNQLLIERCGFSIARYNITPDKHCPYCGHEIPIIGEPNVPDHKGITQY